MRLPTLDQLAECKWELEETKEENRQLQKVKNEYKLYTETISKLFPRQHERILIEIKEKETKKKKD